jgi:hypothetical protein
MIRELDENELLVRAFFRSPKKVNTDFVLMPADFERRRKPFKKRDDNGLSLSRLVTSSSGVSELPQTFKDKFSNSPSSVGFATASVRELRNLGYKVIADGEFHISLLCEFCNLATMPGVCEAADSEDCSISPGTDLSLRQMLATRFKIEPAMSL